MEDIELTSIWVANGKRRDELPFGRLKRRRVMRAASPLERLAPTSPRSPHCVEGLTEIVQNIFDVLQADA